MHPRKEKDRQEAVFSRRGVKKLRPMCYSAFSFEHLDVIIKELKIIRAKVELLELAKQLGK